MLLVLTILNICGQVAIVPQVIAQLRSPLQFPRWKVAWWCMLATTCGMAGKRILDFFDPPAALELVFGIGTTASLFMSLWLLRSIFEQELSPPSVDPVAHIRIDEFSQILAWDAPATRIFGWSSQEATGQTLMQTVMLPRDWEKHRLGMAAFLAADVQKRVLQRTYTATARRKNGTEIPIELTITAVPTAGVPTYTFVAEIRELVHL